MTRFLWMLSLFTLLRGPLSGQEPDLVQHEYRLLATRQTSTMQAEMNEAAQAGFRVAAAMGGTTAFGGREAVVIMSRAGEGDAGRYQYLLLATSRTSTLQSELQDAGRAGYRYVAQTVYDSSLGGREVVAILERPTDVQPQPYEYLLLATRRTSTLEEELSDAGREGYELMGLTVGETRFGGREVLAILARASTE